MTRGRRSNNSKKNGATLGFEATLWAADEKLRNNMDAVEYKHVVLGIMSLMYISNTFEEMLSQLCLEVDRGTDSKTPDEYRVDNMFWVAKEAQLSFLPGNAKQYTSDKKISSFMDRILSILQESKTPYMLCNSPLAKLLSEEIWSKDSRIRMEANQWT